MTPAFCVGQDSIPARFADRVQKPGFLEKPGFFFHELFDVLAWGEPLHLFKIKEVDQS